MIIETSNGQFFQVREGGYEQAWIGSEVKKVKGVYEPKAKAKQILIRKAFTKVIQA